jgi:hypothetical protein
VKAGEIIRIDALDTGYVLKPDIARTIIDARKAAETPRPAAEYPPSITSAKGAGEV